MIREISQSLRCFFTLTLLTGVIYPFLITVLGQFFWPQQANGSLIYRDGKLLGSELIAQKMKSDRYFHSRPSAVDYATLPSGASNLAPTSAVLKESVQTRIKTYGEYAPSDLLSSSGSGLDPHLSPDAVFSQIERVAQSRGLLDKKIQELKDLVIVSVEGPTFGFMGKSRVNILKLNIALDRRFP